MPAPLDKRNIHEKTEERLTWEVTSTGDGIPTVDLSAQMTLPQNWLALPPFVNAAAITAILLNGSEAQGTVVSGQHIYFPKALVPGEDRVQVQYAEPKDAA